MSNNLEDTIVAISTPLGFGGLGIVRLSGKNAIKIAEEIFVPKNKSKVVSQLKTFTIHLGYIVEDKKIIDEVLLAIMRSPHSYTCEDVVEFSCHGGPVVLKKIVELCLKKGARLAEPGEFTKRAFLNGRIDLTQAEAVCDLIYSQSEIQRELFIHSLLGKVKNNIQKFVEKIEEIIAKIELCIEYPQEEDSQYINFFSLNSEILKLKEEISLLIENSQKITPIITGINLAIVGKVNVGKSSLLNILLSYERAIVSEIPGTTRDVVSETINLNGLPIRIVDTAGIRDQQYDVIEKIGIEKTKEAIREANVILLLLDGSRKLTEDDFLVGQIIKQETKCSKHLLVVINKKDLPMVILNDMEKLKELFDMVGFKKEAVFISCITKEGIKELQQKIFEMLGFEENLSIGQDIREGTFVANLRQLEIFKKVKELIEKALNKDITSSPELVVEDLKEALRELKKILGFDITEDILNIIFSKFCVGK
ncbi:MAG: tRNA uridine-5-carboxymethylaminomethyl(34) synthesis GTPase MnmE [Endomicrobiia bacterium]